MLKSSSGKKVGNAFVLAALEGVAKVVHLGTKDDQAHIGELTCFAVRTKSSDCVIANEFLHAAPENMAGLVSNRHSKVWTCGNASPM